MNLKKSLALPVAFVLIASLLLSACAKDDGGVKKAADTSVATPKGTFPIVKEPVTLKVMAVGNPLIKDIATNEFTKWYEEKTNVHIEWDVVQQDAAQQKLAITLASGNYPDVFLGFPGLTPGLQMVYGPQGVLVPLNDYIDKYGAEFPKVLQQRPKIKDEITAADGKIYALPQAADCFHCSFPVKLWIYKPWLDKLGLQVPQTPDEFEQALQAFKSKDPNGNGKPDEIPFAGSISSTNGFPDTISFLMNAFVFTDPSSHFLYNQNGKITASFNQPGWKEGVKYLNKLFSQGLIAEESFTQNSAKLLQMGENSETPILGAAPGSHMGAFTQLNGQSGRWKQFAAVPPLKGPGGVQGTPVISGGLVLGTFAVTSAAKHPEVAYRWADEMFDMEIGLRSVEGVMERDWRMAKAGETGVDGKPAKWTRAQQYGTVTNNAWRSLNHPNAKDNQAQISDGNDSLEGILFNESKTKYEPFKKDILPTMYFNEEDSKIVEGTTQAIEKYLAETTTKFIYGRANIDAEWNTYLDTLNKMGLPKLLEIYQKTNDAKMKK